MLKKVLILGAVVLAGLFVAKKTHLCSYASTLWTQVRQEAKAQVPTEFELDRVRNEITRMDGDIRGMVGPIAENMAAVTRLKREIDRTRSTLTDQKANLLTMTTDLKGGETTLVYDGVSYPRERIQQKLQRDFASFKRLETNLAQQEKLLAAKERALDATREQVAKLVSAKREFEIRLGQLEAQRQELEIAKIGSDRRVDDGRATDIKSSLDEIEHRLEVQRNEVELLTKQFATDNINVQSHGNNTTNVDEIRTYLQGPAANSNTTTASRK